MIQEQYTTKQRKFQHLAREKRAQIEILLRQGLPKAQIAKEVGIARSSLSREHARGTTANCVHIAGIFGTPVSGYTRKIVKTADRH